MTNLPTDRAPTTAPNSGSSTSAGPTSQEPVPPSLGAVIARGLRVLGDLHHLSQEVVSGQLGHLLHTVTARYEQRTLPDRHPNHLAPVVISVRVASAHLDAGNLTDAHLALQGAQQALPHRDRHTLDAAETDTDTAEAHTAEADAAARAAIGNYQQGLRSHAVLAQAAGILAEHTGHSVARARTALRRHAEHHHVVLTELADDVIAGRVTPNAVLDPARRARTPAHLASPHRVAPR